MASAVKDKNGCYRILFVAPAGGRKALHVGPLPDDEAERTAKHVECLRLAKKKGYALDGKTARWLAACEDEFHAKLAKYGLAEPREVPDAPTLGKFTQAYIDGRSDVKDSTARHLGDARRNLIEFFGEDRPLADVSPGDADDYRRWLLSRLGENTARRRCGRAKQFFQAALRKRLIAQNPFEGMKGCTVKANKDREHFITRDVAQKVLDACPDNQWRLLFVLSRYGGLRCPSEHLALTWQDVDWERGRIIVRSPKTEAYEGKAERVIPIFPELRPYLDDVYFDPAQDGSLYVITRYRDANANLRTQLQRIIRKAGVKPWPKLFQNLRATRATELANEYPAHVAAAWLGHSTVVASKHYWQVTDADFSKALEPTAHKTAQSASETPRHGGKAKKETPEFSGAFAGVPTCSSESVTPTGLEPVLPP